MKSITNGRKGVELTVNNFANLILQERDILNYAEDADDEGTASLMSDYISETEKILWMLNSYLKQKLRVTMYKNNSGFSAKFKGNIFVQNLVKN